MTSYNHSQAIQGFRICEEKGSTRGIECVASISCPVRMCQPIPASPNNFADSGVNTSEPSSATKIKSATDGISQRSKAFPWVPADEELLEPSAIA
jgi:hypothetical protein